MRTRRRFARGNRTRYRYFSPCARNICCTGKPVRRSLNSGQADGFLYAGILVFAARGAPPFLVQFCQPSRRPSATAASPSRQTLQAHNGLFDLFAFLTQFRKDLRYVHLAPRQKFGTLAGVVVPQPEQKWRCARPVLLSFYPTLVN